MTRPFVYVLGLSALLGLIGCGGAERLVPVSGKITVHGKPLVDGRIVFHPDSGQGNTTRQEPRGSINEQGVYELRSGDRPGAPLGWYTVAIFAMKQPRPGDGLKPPEWLANQKYSDEKVSGLRVQVVENPTTGAYDFELKP